MFSLNNTTSLARQVDIHGKRSDKLNFPSTRSVLWDPTPKGKPIGVHPTQFRNCSVTFEEQTLRLAQRLSQDCTDDAYYCALQGSIYRHPDGEGMCVCIERMDFNQHSDGASLTGEVSLPFVLKRNGTQVDMVTADDYGNCIKAVLEHCSVKDKIELSRFVSLRSSGSIHLNKDSMSCSLDVDLVMAGTTFQATSINPVPIVPSALSKNLSGPVSLSEVQGEPKTGYLTMDQTRKLLLVLESDPKASSLPLVGIWVSGVTAVYDSFVWAACLRYLHNMNLQDRVCVPPEHFLVVVYSPLHSKPEFYQFTTDNGKPDLKMALYTSHTVVTMPNRGSERPSSPVEVELERVINGDKANLFHAALHSTKDLLEYKRRRSVTPKRPEKIVSHDDITPRNIPAPHFAKAQIAKPLVPEVSLLYDDNEPNTKVPVPTAKQLDHPERQATPKSMSPQVRDPSRGPLKPVNRTTAGPVNPVTKGGLDTQAHHLNPGYQQRHFAQGYCVPIHSAAPPHAPSHTNMPLYQTSGPGPHMQPAVTMPQVHQQPIPNVGYFPNSSYQMYPGPMNQPQVMSYGRGPMPVNSYAMQQIQNPHIYTQSQFPIPQQPIPGQRAHHQMGTVNHPASVNHSAFTEVHRSGANLAPGVTPPHMAPQAIFQNQSGPPMAVQPHKASVAGNTFPQNQGPQPGAMTQSPVNSQIPVTQSPTRYPGQNIQQLSAETSPIHHSESQPSSAATSPGSVSNTSVGSNGSQVPPEVLQLLQHQDQQLKELKEQLASLLAKQNTPEQSTLPTQTKDLTTTATQMSAVQTPVKLKPTHREMCTIATNTSLWCQQNDSHNQTSNTHNGTADTQDSGRGSHRHDTHDSWRTLNDSTNIRQQYFDTTDHTPLAQEQYANQWTQNKQGTHSPPREHFENNAQENGSPGRTINDNISLNDLHAAQIPNQCQEESMMSQMVVDMPAYTSMSPDRFAEHNNSAFNDTDESTRSPQIGESVSMYDEQHLAYETNVNHEADTGLGDTNPDASLLLKDPQGFSKKFLGNIQNMLHKQPANQYDESDLQSTRNESDKKMTQLNSTLESSMNRSGAPKSSFNPRKSDADVSVDIAEVTRRQLQKLGVDVDGLSSNDTTLRGEQSLFMFDHLMLPRINYTSLMLDNDSDVSADADALAMKYLSDEQLAELAKLRIRSPKSSTGRKQDIGLERLLNNTTLGPSPGISMYGMSANNMSFATKKFLEKYGLATGVEPDVSKSSDDLNESFVDTSSGEHEASNTSLHDAKKVKDVLHKLVHQKFLANGSFCETQNDNSEMGGETRLDQSCYSNCSSNSSRQGESRSHQFPTHDDYRVHGGHRQHSTTSDTTQYRTPERTRVAYNAEDEYEKASSDHTPVRVFDESFRKHHQIRPFGPQDLIKPSSSARASTGQSNKSGRQILDIERLKGLPKLL